MRIFAIPFEEISCTRDLKRKSEGLFIGVWRSWLAHLVWDQRVLCSSHSTPTYERLSVWMTSFFGSSSTNILYWVQVPKPP